MLISLCLACVACAPILVHNTYQETQRESQKELTSVEQNIADTPPDEKHPGHAGPVNAREDKWQDGQQFPKPFLGI